MLNVRIDAERWGFRWLQKFFETRISDEVWSDLKSRAEVTGVARRELYRGRVVGITIEYREPANATGKETI
jgi:hypothetical protein